MKGISLLAMFCVMHLCSRRNCCIITPMEYRTIKVWMSTYQKLRLLAALTGESMLAALDRLVMRELEAQQKEQRGDSHIRRTED